MIYINHWPDMADLALPKPVSQDLYRQLLEPFASEGEAKQFWKEAPSTIIILDPHDSNTALKESDAWNQIEFAMTYPEYTVQLNMDYQLLLAVANDSGSGIYLVDPPELSHIISELDHHE